MDFAQKTVVVFGASRGIGLATATHFAKAGANVVMLASNLRALEQAAEEIGPMSGSILIRVCDVADYKQVENMINFTFSSYERLDVVVNNAGVIEPLSVLHESGPEVWSRAVDINFKGVYYSMRAALPIMRSQQFGTIINMSSGSANSALNGWSHYCSTKSAAKKLTEVAHVECQNDGINIIGLSPGTVAT
ncbi:MAG: SDR family oxidoreductase, partial [Pseudomonadota bacterium]